MDAQRHRLITNKNTQMRHPFNSLLASLMKIAIISSLSFGAMITACNAQDLTAPLPADAGRNFALNRSFVASDPNAGWDKGLTDGSWEGNNLHTFATGAQDAFPKTVTVDLEKSYLLSLVRLGVPSLGSTKTIKVAVSADGKSFTEVGSYVFSQSKAERHLYTFAPVAARYVRLTYPDHYAEMVAFAPNYVFTTEFEAYAPTDKAAQQEPVRPPTGIAPVSETPPAAVVASGRPNLALGKTYVVSDPNPSNWGIGGLTNGSWQPNQQGAFATGNTDAFPKTATVDLGQVTQVGHIITGVPAFGSTKTIEVSLSTDGQTFTKAGSYVFSQSKVENHLYTLTPASARYVRLTYPDHYDEKVGYPQNYSFTTELEVYPPGTTPTLPTAQVAPAPAAAQPIQPADIPAFKLGADGNIDASFKQQHERFLQRGKEGPIGVLFVGDSITAGWGGARDIWQAKYGKYNPANFGIGGDRTPHVLWRIANGELDGLDPKVVVLMLGTNNIGSGAPPDEATKGVQKVVSEIHRKLPNAKLLLLGIFPRGADAKNAWINTVRGRINSVNVELAKLDDGNKTRYLDIGAKFLDADGNLPADVMPDALHPNVKGYQIRADAMQPLLDEMMK